ncbi:FkbM family methyltransferase [Sphingomonas sp. AP4-R1]|uniref:FkbM family methyltransferase n=1 Tax=Sphingomonas sp. AP4-R1 TaxID=2735134 RepID=UPI0014932F4C|nr:FkbM family methyltransferase [Sphingomonas sp. AP4-R1]QJU58905.1 FkbM family methyltransferase [Sphingomonas sp. AP4-R1]
MRLESVIALVYGKEVASRRDLVADVRNRLGYDIVASLEDLRAIGLILDRQTYPTPLTIQISQRNIGEAVINGISCPVDAHDASVAAPAIASGSYEPHIATCLRRIVKKGDTCFDIGANIGIHSMLMANLAGPLGRVIAFEPNSENCRVILAGRGKPEHAKIDLVPIALADMEGWTYFTSHLGSNGGMIAERTVQANGYGNVIPMFRLDSLSLPDPDMIKIDVEGAEYRVLMGGESLIDRTRPWIISEFSTEMLIRVSAIDPIALLSWLAKKDYAIHIIDRESDQLRPEISPEELIQFWPSPLHIEDILLAPREKLSILGV